MDAKKKTLWVALLAALAVTQTGCTMDPCSGGGPLKRDELGDWAGMAAPPAPGVASLQKRARKLATCTNDPSTCERVWEAGSRDVSIEWGRLGSIPLEPAYGMEIRAKFNNPLNLAVLGESEREYLYTKPQSDGGRSVYAINRESCYVFLGGEQADGYDVATGRRVAAQKQTVALSYLLYTRFRLAKPVDEAGKRGLHAIADPAVDLDEVDYDLRDVTTIACGLFGWGRVNRKRYIQILWIPIQVGDAKL